MANNKKHVIVAALDSTFERKPFKNVIGLVPISESIIKLDAICIGCRNMASFSRRKIASD